MKLDKYLIEKLVEVNQLTNDVYDVKVFSDKWVIVYCNDVIVYGYTTPEKAHSFLQGVTYAFKLDSTKVPSTND